MKCPTCSGDVRDDARFCSHCGNVIPKPTPCRACGEPLVPGRRFCGKCGATVAVAEEGSAAPMTGPPQPALAETVMAAPAADGSESPAYQRQESDALEVIENALPFPEGALREVALPPWNVEAPSLGSEGPECPDASGKAAGLSPALELRDEQTVVVPNASLAEPGVTASDEAMQVTAPATQAVVAGTTGLERAGRGKGMIWAGIIVVVLTVVAGATFLYLGKHGSPAPTLPSQQAPVNAEVPPSPVTSIGQSSVAPPPAPLSPPVHETDQATGPASAAPSAPPVVAPTPKQEAPGQAKRRVVNKPAPLPEPEPLPPAQANPVERPPTQAPAVAGWLAGLRADLAACDRRSFFERFACREKARWSHCAPDRWNTVPECEVGNR